jgi:tetratricopeptide (TPR) repeat protein
MLTLSNTTNAKDSTSSFVLLLQIKAQSLWRQLSRLYQQLGDADILIGLAPKLSLHHAVKTKLALDAEINGDYAEALKIYDELNNENTQYSSSFNTSTIQSTMENDNTKLEEGNNHNSIKLNDLNDEEQKIWSNRSMICLTQLCNWDELYRQVDKNVLQYSNKLNVFENNMSNDHSDSNLAFIMSTLQLSKTNDVEIKERFSTPYLTSLLHCENHVSELQSF